jgi:hypothetical protein
MGTKSNIGPSIPRWLIPASVLLGIAFLSVIITLAVKIPSPTPTQFFVFRAVVALGGAAFSMAMTGLLTIRANLPGGSKIVAEGALAVFFCLFLTPSIPGVPKPEPLVDPRGDLLESPANESELEVIRLQDQIQDLRQFKESVQQPDSRRRLTDAPSMAEKILTFSDSNLNPRRRFIKYEFAAFAYVDATAAAMFDDRRMVEEYASRAIENADSALTILDSAKHSYSSDQESRFLLDWIPKHQGMDRVLYLRADAECMLGTTRNDASLKSKARVTWDQISSNYQKDLPAAGTPQLSPCVPKQFN